MSAEDFRQWAMRQPGALVSGGPVGDGFESGWGHHPFMRGMKAHFWGQTVPPDEDGAYGIRSGCGLFTVVTRKIPLLEPGNLPFCTRCENVLMKAMKQ